MHKKDSIYCLISEDLQCIRRHSLRSEQKFWSDLFQKNIAYFDRESSVCWMYGISSLLKPYASLKVKHLHCPILSPGEKNKTNQKTHQLFVTELNLNRIKPFLIQNLLNRTLCFMYNERARQQILPVCFYSGKVIHLFIFLEKIQVLLSISFWTIK